MALLLLHKTIVKINIIKEKKAPEKLQCTVASVLQVFGTVLAGWSTTILKDIPNLQC